MHNVQVDKSNTSHTLNKFHCLAKSVTWPDEWTATTTDGKRSAQFEHTLLVTLDGVEALTGKLESSPIQFWERESKVHQGIFLGTSASACARSAEINALLLPQK